MDGKLLQEQYKEFISGFKEWKQASHAYNYVLFPENFGEHISMDETCLSQGELYTIITNKAARGGKGALIGMFKGTKSEDILHYLYMIPRHIRLKVKEITIDLSPTMKLIAKKAFPNADIVSDRFHVQKLMGEAINDVRVKYRWEAIDQENAEMKLAKEVGQKFISHTFDNGDTRRQLLARSRYVVMKHSSKWTTSQSIRAEILFEQYPEIQEAYIVSQQLSNIYNKTKISKEELNKIDKLKGVKKAKALKEATIRVRNSALTKLAHWYKEVDKLDSKYFNSVITTMQNNYAQIANFFLRRATNASAESFNAKVKAFRAQFRGVRDIPYFIFRLTKLFA